MDVREVSVVFCFLFSDVLGKFGLILYATLIS